MGIIAQDLKDISEYVARDGLPQSWKAYLNLLETLAVDTEETAVGETPTGFKKARYYFFIGGSMIRVLGDPTASSDYEIRAYDSIE